MTRKIKLSDLVFCIGPHDVLHPVGWVELKFPKNANVSCVVLADEAYDQDFEYRHIVNFKDAQNYFLEWLDNWRTAEVWPSSYYNFFDFKPHMEWLLTCPSRDPILRTTVKTLKTENSEWGWTFNVDILISPEDIPYYTLKFD